MKRSEIKRTAMKARKTKRQSEYDREFAKVKPEIRERSKGQCESWSFVRDNCSATTQDLYHETPIAATCEFNNPVHVHHRKYRGRGGTNDSRNLVHLCEPCHSWVHAHGGFGETANLLGLALSSGEGE